MEGALRASRGSPASAPFYGRSIDRRNRKGQERKADERIENRRKTEKDGGSAGGNGSGAGFVRAAGRFWADCSGKSHGEPGGGGFPHVFDLLHTCHGPGAAGRRGECQYQFRRKRQRGGAGGRGRAAGAAGNGPAPGGAAAGKAAGAAASAGKHLCEPACDLGRLERQPAVPDSEKPDIIFDRIRRQRQRWARRGQRGRP